ncbi:MAG TPA: ABC transporter permease [Firmicutes bacterium]|nr:ABC transporter permease [Bacillota bacterium]
MKNFTFKMLMRSIRSSAGRYLAILAIIALGVGFFSGLKNARPAMEKTAEKYLSEHNLYDFELISTLGFTESDVDAFNSLDGILTAEGGYSTDVLAYIENSDEQSYKVYGLPSEINTIELISGRLPQSESECVVDADIFSEEDIGKTITFDKSEKEDDYNLSRTEFTIVGLVQSPLYISNDRGTSALGDGTASGFIYINPDLFTTDAYTELWLDADIEYTLLSNDYTDAINAMKGSVTSLLEERVQNRYNSMVEEIEAKYGAQATAIMSSIPQPETYTLTQEENEGLVFYKNDTSIVDSVANVFPAFFLLIAALVCMTSMTRMVNEDRTQIGTLKAMGYRASVICMKYILYSGSAAIIGTLIGFFLGTWGLPEIIWMVYGILYHFAPLEFEFLPVMLIGCLAVSLACTVGVTLFSCIRELMEKPAQLIRPKSPKNGKRILLERIKPLWNKLSFLVKVMIRNALRYKKRMFMMLLGIGGCTALLLAGFGLRDSISHVLDDQYEKILHYDLSVAISDSTDDAKQRLEDTWRDYTDASCFLYQTTADVSKADETENVTIVSSENGALNGFVTLKSGDDEINSPKKGEIVLSSRLAENLNAAVGDTISVTDADKNIINLTLTGICDNYVGHYAYISEDSWNSIPEDNTAYLILNDSANEEDLSVKLRQDEAVTSVTSSASQRDKVQSSMSSMNYIVLVIIICAGALAFIVLFNLTNINLIERTREVATVKVLGFHKKEEAAYILRENIFLSGIGGAIGLVFGKLLHWYVMAQIHVDIVSFDIKISVLSYIFAFALTMLFAFIVNFFMRFKLDRIDMAESLKSVE